MFDEFDDDDFVDLAATPKPTADLIMSVIALGRTQRLNVQFSFAEHVLAEIAGPRYAIAFAVSKRTGASAFRIKGGPNERYEPMQFGRSKGAPRRLLRCPAPVGPAFRLAVGMRVEPEFFVDRQFGQILVEVPKVSPATQAAPPALPAISPSRQIAAIEAPKRKAALDDEDADRALDARLRDMLTGGLDVPQVIGGIRFTPAERLILAALLAHPTMSREGLLAATHDGVGDDERADRLVDVFITKMRPRLNAIQVRIENTGGGVYRMPMDDKARLRKLIEEDRRG